MHEFCKRHMNGTKYLHGVIDAILESTHAIPR